MLRFFALLMGIAASCSAQQAEPYQPQYWIGAGASYNRYAVPPAAAGWMDAAVKIADRTYSLTTIDMTSNASSLRTGFGRILLAEGNFTLLAHADGGLTTGNTAGSSAVTLGSFSGGGMLLYDLGGIHPRLRHTYLAGVMRILAISSVAVQPVFEFGFGKSF